MPEPLEGKIQAYHIRTREGKFIGSSGETGCIGDILGPGDMRKFIPFKAGDFLYVPKENLSSMGSSWDLFIGVVRQNILPFGMAGKYHHMYTSRSWSDPCREAYLATIGKKDPLLNQVFHVELSESEIKNLCSWARVDESHYFWLPRAFGFGFPNKPSAEEFSHLLSRLSGYEIKLQNVAAGSPSAQGQ